jgi:hypothetical protein
MSRSLRSDGAVDEAGGEDLELGEPPLALEEAAGDLPHGERLLDVVDHQGKEVDPGPGVFRHAGGDQHHRVTVPHHRGAARLLGPAARFDGQGPTGYFRFVHVSHGICSLLVAAARAAE